MDQICCEMMWDGFAVGIARSFPPNVRSSPSDPLLVENWLHTAL